MMKIRRRAVILPQILARPSAKPHLLRLCWVRGRFPVVIKGARSQHVLRRQRQRVDPVPVPLQRSHQLALLRHKHTNVSQSMWQSQRVAIGAAGALAGPIT